MDVKNQLPSFWTIQLVGWIVYFVVIYITFLTIAPPENFFNLFLLKGFRALTGFFLTSLILRPIYRRFGIRRSFTSLVLPVLVWTVIFGAIWTAIEAIYVYMTVFPFNVNNYLARSPRIALDYAVTLMAWSAFYLGVKHWRAWQTERENALESAALAQKAQLEMLRYQLNPHFLFNALNSIRASVGEEHRQAREMITQLSDFLRHSLLAADSREIPLAEELDAARNYLAIEKIRFEDDLEVEFDIDQTASEFRVPSFILNPLIENAVKHGFRNGQKPLKIRISATANVGGLVLEVSNSGVLEETEASGGTGIGLINVRDRLRKLFGAAGVFELQQEGKMVVARIKIPAR